jgi:pilus assembly protein CpaC
VAITVDYREFGVRLNFVPVVLGDGRIRLKLAPEVSDLDFSSGLVNQGFRIPIINKRRVETTIELTEGQTFAIAGLLNHSVQASADSTPGLGDLPYIGALFRSVRYQRRETELLVLVTPYLVEGMSSEQVPAMPGEKWRHPTENQLFWEKDLGGPDKSGEGEKVATEPVRFKGEYGFQPAEATASTGGAGAGQ